MSVNAISDEEKLKILTKYNSGIPVYDIAKEQNRCRSSIYNVLREQGIDFKSTRSGRTYVWIKVTRDKYEFPIFITDTAKEMAEHEGKTVNAIKSAAKNHNAGLKSIYRKVEII